MKKLVKRLGTLIFALLAVLATVIVCVSIWGAFATTAQVGSAYVSSRSDIVESREETKRVGIEWRSRVEIERIRADGAERTAIIQGQSNGWYTFRWLLKMAAVIAGLLILFTFALEAWKEWRNG